MSSYLDTRDLNDEIDELEALRDRAAEEGDPFSAYPDECKRYQALIALRDDIGSEWRHGVALIPESEFEDYAQQLAEDCYEIPDTFAPYIDWSRWADDVRSDYSCVEFDDETYYFRS